MIKKTIFIFSLFACCHLLTSCSVVSSSIQYTYGTECLESRDYTGAIQHLEKAVRLDPESARNQGNLAVAYLCDGNMDKAWYHSRKSVLCNHCTFENLHTFFNLYLALIKAQGLEQKGTLLEDVLCVLGEPDYKLEKPGFQGLYYGRCSMIFENNKLIDCSISLLPEEC